PATTATRLLALPDRVSLARRIAEAVAKLHQANIAVQRSQKMEDELRILDERLALVAQIKPEWSKRLKRLLGACDRLGAALPPPCITGIHRDLYPAQVMVDGRKVYLLDFDCFCRGDPALDV